MLFEPVAPNDKLKFVAKLYDPLYFNDDDGYLNPFLCTDEYYTHEANAYNHLAESQGGRIPRFFGSYSLDLPDENRSHGICRTVRLILMEYIEGPTMLQVNPMDLSQSSRQHFMKLIIDLESRIYERANLFLTNLSPRNVIMGAESLVFEHALFNRKRDDPILESVNVFPGQYVSPLLRWNEYMIMEFKDWIGWDWYPWIEAEYAHTAGTITPEMREAFSLE